MSGQGAGQRRSLRQERLALSEAIIALTAAAERGYADAEEAKRLTADVREAIDRLQDRAIGEQDALQGGPVSDVTDDEAEKLARERVSNALTASEPLYHLCAYRSGIHCCPRCMA